MATVKGVWVFNDTIDMDRMPLSTYVNFTSYASNNYGEFTTLYGIETLSNRNDLYYTYSLNGELYKSVVYYETTGWSDVRSKVVDFGSTEQEVSDEFFTWLTANATQQASEEETTGGVTITYNGSTIASLFGGDTATLKCKGMKMESDVVVEVETADPVLQTLEVNITKAGTFEFTPESGYDGISKVIVSVDGAGVTAPQLTAPNISLNEGVLTIEATHSGTERFAIFVDGVEMIVVENKEE